MHKYIVTFAGFRGTRDRSVTVTAPDPETAKFDAIATNPGWFAVRSVELAAHVNRSQLAA